MAKKLSKAQWEQRIRDTGAGRYEFVRWLFDGKHGSRDKCVVRCSVDNHEWNASVDSIVNGGSGCPYCSGKRRWTAEERIEQINSLDNIEFISWVDGYENNYSKANVMCLVDKYAWSARVSDIINGGHGCPHCSGKRRWTADERVEQINKLDNILFLSWVDSYKNCYSKAKVICSLDWHEWSAAVNNLLNGRGCPRCAKYGFQLDKTGYLYALRSECGKYVKVGISNNPSQRHKQLELATPFGFSCIEQFEDDGAKIAELEKYFHGKYERAGFTGYGGATEWLVCTPQLLEELRTIGDK